MPTYLVQGEVHTDANEDGVLDGGDPLYTTGVTLTWQIDRGAGWVTVDQVVSDNLGQYSMTAALADDPASCRVVMTLPIGFRSTASNPILFTLDTLNPFGGGAFLLAPQAQRCFYSPQSSWIFKV